MQESHYSKIEQESQQFSHSSAPLSNLQKFLNNYNKFIEQSAAVNFNTHTILSDIALNLLEPPQTFNEQQNKELLQLYLKGKKLPELLEPNCREYQDMYVKFKKLKDDKLQETITIIEQLNLKLNKQYEDQVQRGVNLGLYAKKMYEEDPQNLLSSQKTQKRQNGGHAMNDQKEEQNDDE